MMKKILLYNIRFAQSSLCKRVIKQPVIRSVPVLQYSRQDTLGFETHTFNQSVPTTLCSRKLD